MLETKGPIPSPKAQVVQAYRLHCHCERCRKAPPGLAISITAGAYGSGTTWEWQCDAGGGERYHHQCSAGSRQGGRAFLDKGRVRPTMTFTKGSSPPCQAVQPDKEALTSGPAK